MCDCLFCKIANKEISANIVYEDEKVIAFHDISKVAPMHVLLIPKKHIASLDDATSEDVEILGHLLTKVKGIAKELGATDGYRVVSNNGEDALQTVKHIHFHIIGKRKMTWPPG